MAFVIIHPPDIFVDYWQSVLKYYWFDKRPKPGLIKCKINLVEITQAKWYQLNFVMLVLPISFTTFCVPQEKQNVPNTLLHVTFLTQYIPHILAFKSLNNCNLRSCYLYHLCLMPRQVDKMPFAFCWA